MRQLLSYWVNQEGPAGTWGAPIPAWGRGEHPCSMQRVSTGKGWCQNLLGGLRSAPWPTPPGTLRRWAGPESCQHGERLWPGAP